MGQVQGDRECLGSYEDRELDKHMIPSASFHRKWWSPEMWDNHDHDLHRGRGPDLGSTGCSVGSVSV